MAYRGGAGFWIAIAFLFIVAATFFGLWYQRETKILEMENVVRTANTQTLWDQYKNQNVRDKLDELQTQIDKTREIAAQKDQVELELNATKSSLQEELARAARLNTQIETLKTQLQEAQRQKTNAEAEAAKWRKHKDARAAQQIQNLKDEYAQAQIRMEKLSRDLKNAEEREQNLRTAYQKRIMELQRVNSGLQEVIAKWQKETGRQEAIKTEQYDGRIIQVDVDNKFVVVDLGRVHNIQRGMRFDVIRWRLNKWDYMGSVEITEVNATTSNGVILDAIVQQKVCPVTGYVAKDPAEKYSPYAATGANQDRVVELVKTDQEEKSSMRKLDPIVIGDYITNVFYSKDRELKFVVAGEPVKYSQNEIHQMIKRYGGTVQQDIDVDTDYLVLGRVPDDNTFAETEEAIQRRERTVKAREMALQYGIPIMREVELLNILSN